MKTSLWGKVDHETKLQRGMYSVSTPSHGGIIVAKGIAEKVLSAAALKRGHD